MAFSSADYQDMGRRRRNKNGNGSRATQQVSQAARQARSGSSRQGSMANLNRGRPGVPAMPVQGLGASGSGQQGEEAQSPGATGLDASSGQPAGGQSGMMGAAQTMASATNYQSESPSAAGAGATGLDASSGQPATTPGAAAGVPQSIQNMVNNGAFGNGMGAGLAGAEQSEFVGGFLADPEEARRFAESGEGTQAEFDSGSQMPAGMGQDQGGIGQLATPEYGDLLQKADMTGGLDAGLPPGATEDDYFDRLAEERAMFEDIIQGLQNERSESQGLILKGISEQQRRQAEMNALAGRSVGGGFGGAMATTSAMGAAAMEEADRAIRDKMREAQIGWLDTVSRLNESERGREFQREMSDEDRAFQLELGAMEGEIDLPGESGGGSAGTGGSVQGGGEGGGEGGPSQSSFSQRDMWDQGFRRDQGSGEWVNEDGQTWSEVYPDEANPYDGAVTYGGMQTSTMNENPQSPQGQNREIPDFWWDETGDVADEIRENFGFLEDYDGNLMDAFNEGMIDFKELQYLNYYTQNPLTQVDGVSLDLDYLTGEFAPDYLDFVDPTTQYQMEDGTSVRGNEIEDVLLLLEDISPELDSTLMYEYGGDPITWALHQPGLFNEIKNYMLSQRSDNPDAIFNHTDFASGLRTHLNQSGYLQPER